MRRRSTILSLPSLVIFSVLLTALGLAIWRGGGLAFSPGDLSGKNHPDIVLAGYSSHAEFEGQCSLCHQPLTSLQADLCVDCHSGVEDQITMKNSLHGNLKNVMQCAECHSDHQGREFDLRLGNLGDFDHSMIAFSLIWHQVDYSLAPIECLDCHVTDDRFSVSTISCATCHANHDGDFMLAHVKDFGDGCMSCHDGLDSMARFEHANSDFHLLGMHQEISCVECHVESQFEDLQSDCASCHAEPAGHSGFFGTDCAACHDANAWKPAVLEGGSFDHNTGTRFSLVLHTQDYAGASMSCQSCHPGGIDEFTPETCFQCHAPEDQDFMIQHQAELGGQCIECHDGVDRMRNFDHQDYFPLEGGHGVLECQSCHVNQVYQGTPGECKDCHLEPEIHAGFFGLTCEYCHESNSWYPGQLQKHSFPIDHGDQGESECQTCHVATYSEYSCYTCHEHTAEEVLEKHDDLNLPAGQLAACTDCHLDGLVHELNEKDD